MLVQMKLLLIAINAKYQHSNPAVYSIYHYLKQEDRSENIHEWDIEILESNINQSLQEIQAILLRKNADVYAFSVYIWNREYAEQLAKFLLQTRPESARIAGGPELAFSYREEYDQQEIWNYIMPGDGEIELENILHHSTDISSLFETLERKKQISLTKKNCQLERRLNPENIAFYFPKEEKRFSNRIVYYESSRGCPYLCSYCISSLEGNPIFKPMHQVKRELDYFINQRIPLVKFLDRSFNFPSSRAIEIWQHILSRYLENPEEYQTCFHFELEASLLDEASVNILKEAPAGIFQFEIGIQSIHPDILKNVRRHPLSKEAFQNIQKLIDAKKQHIHLDLIAGLPGQNLEHLKASYEYLWHMQPDMIQLGILKLLKGTEVRAEALHRNFSFNQRPPYDVYATDTLSAIEMVRIHEVAEVTDQYYNLQYFMDTLHVLVATSGLDPFSLMEKIAKYYFKARGESLRYLSKEERDFILLEYAIHEITLENLAIIWESFSNDFFNSQKKGSLRMEQIVQKLYQSGKMSEKLWNFINKELPL